LGEVKEKTDRNRNASLNAGQTHAFTYDVVGRLTSDAVTVLGNGVDGTGVRLDTAYDTAGRPFKFTSFNAASGGAVVNEVLRQFNGLGQLTAEYQAHTGTVDLTPLTSTTPRVRYAYSEMSGGANHSRPTQLIYPDSLANPSGRVVNYVYASGVD